MEKVRPNDKFTHAGILNHIDKNCNNTVIILWMDFYFNFIYLQNVFTTFEYSIGLESIYWRKTLAHFSWPKARLFLYIAKRL